MILSKRNLIISVVFNSCMLCFPIMTFGRPYLPTLVYVFGLFAFVVTYGLRYKGTVEWGEKVCQSSTLITLIIEYYYKCYKHWKQTNQKKKLYFLILLLFCVLFPFVYYYPVLSDSIQDPHF